MTAKITSTSVVSYDNTHSNGVVMSICFFFFQAEDGIRDHCVTGVQTCALPIFVHNGCAPEFALWSFVDLGYLTYYTTYMIAAGDIKGVEGETFHAGRLGNYTIEKDPGRKGGLRVVMGPFTLYNKDNVDAASGGPATPAATPAK